MGGLTAPGGLLLIAAWQWTLILLWLLFDFELKTSIFYLIGLWIAFFACGVAQFIAMKKLAGPWLTKRSG
jgi:hypothetical protein